MIDRRFDPAAVRLTDGTYNRPSDYGRPLTVDQLAAYRQAAHLYLEHERRAEHERSTKADRHPHVRRELAALLRDADAAHLAAERLTAVRAWTYDGGKYCATCAVRRHGRHALVDGRALDKSDKSVGALFAVRPSDTCERCGRNLGGVA